MNRFRKQITTAAEMHGTEDNTIQAISAPPSAVPAFFSAALFECLLLLLFLTGICGCLITGFSLSVYPSVLVLGIPLLCVLLVICGRVARHMPAVGVSGVLLLSIWGAWRFDRLSEGLFYTAAAIFRFLCHGFPGIEMPNFLKEYEEFLLHTEVNDLLLASVQAPQTEMFLFFAAVFGLLWYLFYRQLHSVWLAAALPLPVFILCFLIIEITMPALWALLAMLLYWALLLLTRAAVRLHPRAAAAQAAALLLPCLLFFSAVYLWYPREIPVGELVQSGYDKVLTVLSSAETTIAGAANSIFSGNWFTVSAEGSEISFDSLNPRRFLGRTVMRAQCDTTGVVYLRENTYGSYTDKGWEQTVFDGVHAVEPDPFIQSFSAHILASNGVSASRLSLDGARSPLLFSPYYFSDATAEYAFDGDSRITNPARETDYSISFYRFPGNFSALQYDTSAAAAASVVLMQYMTDTVPAYKTIDPALAAELRAILADAGITPSDFTESFAFDQNNSIRIVTDYDAMWKAISDITHFVRGSAKYSLNADKNTTDRDFVLWFLEDAEYGYCTHFATAEVMLLRACGIPARLAAGFLGNIRTADTWTPIKDSNAHAWAEVFDLRLGWVPIEATPPTELSPDMNAEDIIVGLMPIPGDTETEEVTESTSETAAGTETVAITDAPESSDTTADSTTSKPPPQDINTDGDSGGDPSENTGDSGEASGTTPIPQMLRFLGIGMLILLSAAGIVLIAIFCRNLRRKTITALFSADEEDRNACTLRLYRRCVALARACEETIPQELTALAEKARFSHHTITQNELEILRTWYTERCAYLQKKDKPLSRMRHFWIDLYY